MYADDLDLSQAQDWERKLSAELNTSISAARREQAEMDLEDIRERIVVLKR